MRCLCLVSVPEQHSSNTSQERSHLLHSRTCWTLWSWPTNPRVEIRAQSGLTMWQWWIVKEPLIKPWLPLVNAGFRFGANDFANKIQISVLPHLFVDNASLLDGLDFENLSWSQFPTCRDPTKIDDFSEPTTHIPMHVQHFCLGNILPLHSSYFRHPAVPINPATPCHSLLTK